MVYGTYNYSYWGESKPTYNWVAPHCSISCTIDQIAWKRDSQPMDDDNSNVLLDSKTPDL